MNEIRPAEIRYIKLGAGGRWVRPSLERNEVHFGHRTIPHELCLAGDWDAVLERFIANGKSPPKAKDMLREVKDFYTLGADCLWVTFANGHLWWCFADPEVIWLGEAEEGQGARMRKTIGGWKRTNTKGEPLLIGALSSKLTQVAAYRQTICAVKESDYMLRRINGIEEPIVLEAQAAKEAMLENAVRLIAQLHWADFETMVDLIFSRTGWQRISRVGATQKDVDLVLVQPTTGETAFVQVKSRAGQKVLDDYLERFRTAAAYDRFFFVCHSPKGAMEATGESGVHIWTGKSLADASLRAGLYDWLIEHVA